MLDLEKNKHTRGTEDGEIRMQGQGNENYVIQWRKGVGSIKNKSGVTTQNAKTSSTAVTNPPLPDPTLQAKWK